MELVRPGNDPVRRKPAGSIELNQHTEPGDDAVARFRDALVGGHQALLRDVEAVERLSQQFRGLGPLVRAAGSWHRDAAAWAVTSTPALGVIFDAAGYPPPDGALHLDAARAQPHARFAYADDARTKAMNRALLAAADPGRVAAFTVPAASPSMVLTAKESQWASRGGPVSVQLVMALHWWPGDVAAGVLREYGELLPSGSTLCLTMAILEPGRAGEALARAVSEACCVPVYAHTEADLEEWIAAAPRMRLHGDGIRKTPVWAAPPGHVPVRVVDAVALVP